MSDVFREVDEEVRKDQSVEIWKKYGPLIIAAAVAIMAVTGGFIGWKNYQKNQRLVAADTFLSATSVTDADKRASALEQVAVENTGIYGALARIRLAMNLAEDNPDEALAALDRVATTTSIPIEMRQLAEIRAASIAASFRSPGDVLKRVGPLLQPGHAFRYSARELAAVAEIQMGNKQSARNHLQTLIEDQQTPSGIRSRTEALLAIIGEGTSS